jgi:hypothetical protein
MVAASSLSPRALALARTFSAAFEALKDHSKHSPAEQQQLYEMIAAHLRNAAPLALFALPDPALAPVDVPLPLHIDLEGGAFVEVCLRDDGRRSLYVHDEHEHDADVALTAAQVSVVVHALGGGR